jgi:hypothetical protein
MSRNTLPTDVEESVATAGLNVVQHRLAADGGRCNHGLPRPTPNVHRSERVRHAGTNRTMVPLQWLLGDADVFESGGRHRAGCHLRSRPLLRHDLHVSSVWRFERVTRYWARYGREWRLSARRPGSGGRGLPRFPWVRNSDRRGMDGYKALSGFARRTVGLINDLYAASVDNQCFLHDRLGASTSEVNGRGIGGFRL